MLPQPLPWCDPLALAYQLGAGPMALLYSSVRTSYSGRYSLLGYHLSESRNIEHFSDIPTPSGDAAPLSQGWFCYLGYDMRHDCEHYTPSLSNQFRLPPGRLMRFEDIYVFDHELHTLTLWSKGKKNAPPVKPLPNFIPPPVLNFTSNMTRVEYEEKVAHVLEEIRAGSLYQANLTRKFTGRWNEPPESLLLFARLCEVSPAPYSAYFRMKDATILSSSPEQFVKIDTDGTIRTRPIKGTAPRGKTAVEDEKLREELLGSEKNRAENLMITDLMRSDLSKCCVDGSVVVDGLFDVTAHANVFHMASTVRGKIDSRFSTGEVLRSIFPPGSMTGAPKIRAVELCNQLEAIERGIYSGAIGWLGDDKSAELSVVIRTLIVQENRFEFQIGGGIVADSTPGDEWRETVDKAAGILKAIDIPRNLLESL